MSWSNFNVSGEQVLQYDPDLNITADKLLNFISQAQSDVEDKLKVLIYTKYKNAGKILPTDLPDVILDAFLSDSYSQIRKLVIYKTLEKIYGKETPSVSAYWENEYKKTNWDEITVYIDVDQDLSIDTSEFLTPQDLLDNRQR